MQRRSFIATAAAGLGAPAVFAQSGFDLTKLEALRASLAARSTNSLLILRKGTAVLEWYAPGRTAETKHYTASSAKALVGGTSLLLALNEGRIRINDPAAKYITSWRDDPRRSKITIRHLATHTSGLEDSSVPGIAHPNEPGWKGRFWKREPDPFSISLREAPLLFDPGEGYQYSNPGMAVLAYAVTASLRGAPQSDIQALLRERVMKPLGLTDDQWNIGYGQAYQLDSLDLYANWGGANFTPRATARIAEWMMNNGEWNGKPLVERRWVNQLLKYSGMRLPKRTQDNYAPASALCWYTNFDAVWPAVPRDAFAAAGAGHQIALIVPSLQVVVVRNGGNLEPDVEGRFWTPVYNHLFEPLMAALGYPAKPDELPYPRSKVIRGVEFAPAATIKRQAIECDNWPMTWGDDDNIYTSYGDGLGFEPRLPEKLGMGFARVEGSSQDFRGINIRSDGERKGDGPASPKASGMVMVDGVLYMWVRNVKNSQLLWSADRGRTWEWGFKLERGFGSPAFVSFGKNYTGARDEYVYVFSQEGASAYETDDGILLARAPKTQLREKASWQFAARAGSNGKPVWSADLSAARPVFRFSRHCQRVDAMYHPATKRYLLLVAYGHNGGWGIFDAPEPWGPWSVAFHTEYWGLGETHGYRLNSKWMSKDGRNLALVFSGLIYDGVSYDAFCVREMKFAF